MIKTQNLVYLNHQPARFEGKFAFTHLPADCNISARLSRYFADNRAKLAHYNRKLTRPVRVWLATS